MIPWLQLVLLKVFNFESKDGPTYKILIKDLISYKWKCWTKEARLILHSGINNSFTNISEGTAFLLQGLLAQGMLDDFMAAIF